MKKYNMKNIYKYIHVVYNIIEVMEIGYSYM